MGFGQDSRGHRHPNIYQNCRMGITTKFAVVKDRHLGDFTLELDIEDNVEYKATFADLKSGSSAAIDNPAPASITLL
jgi:hypothetical protein